MCFKKQCPGSGECQFLEIYPYNHTKQKLLSYSMQRIVLVDQLYTFCTLVHFLLCLPLTTMQLQCTPYLRYCITTEILQLFHSVCIPMIKMTVPLKYWANNQDDNVLHIIRPTYRRYDGTITFIQRGVNVCTSVRLSACKRNLLCKFQCNLYVLRCNYSLDAILLHFNQ